MPINIREILYPNDSDTIKWEKVNYNFDQILSNGGKEGPKGTKGDSGSTGATGVKGDKGDIGDQGVKGETGTSTNFWDQFAHDTITANILKPKDGTNPEETIIFIGDTTYEEGVSSGDLEPDAQLVVGQSSSLFYAQRWLAYGTGLTDIAIRGEATSDYDGNNTAGTNWVFQPVTGGTNAKLTIQSHVVKLDAYEKLNISSVDGVEFLSGGNVTVNPAAVFNSTSTFNSAVTVNDDVTITGELSVSGNESFFTGTGSLQIPTGGNGQRTLGSPSGSIRYNSTSNKFEGYNDSSWIDLDRLSNNAKTTYVAVKADTDYSLAQDDKINLVVQSTGVMDLSNTTITARKDINVSSGENVFFLGGSNGVVYPAGGLKSTGTPPAGISLYASPSNGSAEALRRLDDYFYSGDYSPTGIDDGDGELVFGYKPSTGVVAWFDEQTQYGKNSANVNYTKIGNSVMVRGYYDLQVKGFPSASTSSKDIPLIIGLGENIGSDTEKSQFPFTNASASPIYVNVEIFDAEIKNVASSVNRIDDYSTVDIFGLIQPGKNYIELYYTYKETTSGNTAVLTYSMEEFCPEMLSSSSSTVNTNVKFAFSFNMPTGLNTGNNSYTTFSGSSSSVTGGGGSVVGGQ